MADPAFIHIRPVTSAERGADWQQSSAQAMTACTGTVDDLLDDGPYRYELRREAGVPADPLPARDAHRQARAAVRSGAALGGRAGALVVMAQREIDNDGTVGISAPRGVTPARASCRSGTPSGRSARTGTRSGDSGRQRSYGSR